MGSFHFLQVFATSEIGVEEGGKRVTLKHSFLTQARTSIRSVARCGVQKSTLHQWRCSCAGRDSVVWKSPILPSWFVLLLTDTLCDFSPMLGCKCASFETPTQYSSVWQFCTGKSQFYIAVSLWSFPLLCREAFTVILTLTLNPCSNWQCLALDKRPILPHSSMQSRSSLTDVSSETRLPFFTSKKQLYW